MNLDIQFLGRISFEDALAIQEERVAAIQNASAPDTLFLLEHEPVFTIGRTRDISSLRNPSRLPHPVREINRGGQATWHGPGQLVGYPILDLRRRGQDLHLYLRTLEQLLIHLLATWEISASRRDGLTGVWIQDRKIASLGVGVRKWISMHGFALNICGPLEGFHHITPCGIDGVVMTSVERESSRTVTVKEAAEQAARIFREQLDTLLPPADKN